MRHNEIAHELKSFLNKIMPSTAIRDEPAIFPVSSAYKADSAKESDTVQALSSSNSNEGDRGDLLVRGLWNHGVETIIDVRVTDLDAKSQSQRKVASILRSHEKEKRDKYLAACLEQRRSFVPFVVSTDGLLGYEAKNLITQIAKRLALKWSRPYSVVRGLLNARINLAILRASHQCIRGPRNPASKISTKIKWDDGAGLGGFETM